MGAGAGCWVLVLVVRWFSLTPCLHPRAMEGKFKTAFCLCAKVKELSRIIRDGEHEPLASPTQTVWL